MATWFICRLLGLECVPVLDNVPLCAYMCRIQFPDPHARYRSNQVVVNGTAEAVLQARNDLLVRVTEASNFIRI